MSGGVYKITNDANGKIYVGSAVNFGRRWAEHVRLLMLGDHKNRHLQAAWKLYGQDSFTFSVIEILSDKAERLASEQAAIADMSACDNSIGYNISAIATSRLGVKASDETRARIGRSKIGNQNRLGKAHTQETKDKIRSSLAGRPVSDFARAKMSITRKGRPQSSAHIAARCASRWPQWRGAEALSA